MLRPLSLAIALFILVSVHTRAAELVIDPSHVLATFDPRTAIGATIDVHDRDENAKIFTNENVQAMLSAGFQPLSYRLATELGGEAWHWNPEGSWSDPEKAQGYWTSSSTTSKPIEVSYGYRLPRRGNTIDQARNDSYSRIDDGDARTFWKSNPYLVSAQWCLVDLGAEQEVQSIRILWGAPYATAYTVQYWAGNDPINEPSDGHWINFPSGSITNGAGGEVTHRLDTRARLIRYVRILMSASSRTAVNTFTHDETATVVALADRRDSAGFAIAEVSILGEAGMELMKHGPSRPTQSVVWTSSTDPWHRASDIDFSVEQPGLDRLYQLGLTRGLPMLVPVAMLYGTPEDAASEIRYLMARHYAFRQVELGEEPDGQFLSPEDYAALYLRWAATIHGIDPSLQLGGPAFQSTDDIIAYWPDDRDRTSWIGRFIDALRRARRLDDFSFFSFEWYPFDDLCAPAHQQLLKAPAILERVLGQWRTEGLPETIPWLATEYGYSSYAGEAEVTLTAALFNAEFVAQFLSHGKRGAYFYGLEPDVLLRELPCPTWGNLALFLADREHHIVQPLATLWAARLVTQVWALPAGTHEAHAVAGSNPSLTAYALHRPDGSWSLLVVNKSETVTEQVRIRVGRRRVASAELHQFSSREYEWHADGFSGRASPDLEPVATRAGRELTLPPMSLSVIVFR
jgi:hypothetical protein